MSADRVALHYGRSGIGEAILAALRAEGKDVDALTLEDLAPVDEFHLRGREATIELAELARLKPGERALDVGSGLGGAARFLAAAGCIVTGLDLTPAYCEIAADLSQRVGLAERTEFQCGSATAMPFEDGSFDLAWTQHAQMNIADKVRLYSETYRVLAPAGRFVLHDIMAGPQEPARYPTHWAEEESMSSLIAPGDLRALLEQTGFVVEYWRDTTEESKAWFLARAVRPAGAPAPKLGLHLLLGETAKTKVQNMVQNLGESRIAVAMAALRKPANALDR